MSADRCYEPTTSSEQTRLTRAALDIARLNTEPLRVGWSGWYLSGQHATCRLEGTAYVVRMVRPWRKEMRMWFWGLAGRAGGRRAESLAEAQMAAEAAAAIDAAGREL